MVLDRCECVAEATWTTVKVVTGNYRFGLILCLKLKEKNNSKFLCEDGSLYCCARQLGSS